MTLFNPPFPYNVIFKRTQFIISEAYLKSPTQKKIDRFILIHLRKSPLTQSYKKTRAQFSYSTPPSTHARPHTGIEFFKRHQEMAQLSRCAWPGENGVYNYKHVLCVRYTVLWAIYIMLSSFFVCPPFNVRVNYLFAIYFPVMGRGFSLFWLRINVNLLNFPRDRFNF